jgi:DNA repair protein RadD
VELRPIQIDPVNIGVEVLTSKRQRRELLVLPCAFGKSLVISHIVQKLPEDGNVLVLQPSSELLTQNILKYEMYGNKASVYSASKGKKEFGRVIYATSKSVNEQFFKEADIKYVILDEADFSTKDGTRLNELLKSYNILGLTGTPFYIETNGYGSFIKIQTRTKNALFNDIVHVVQMKTMIELGYWSEIRYETVEKRFNREKLKLKSTGLEFEETVLINEFEEEDLFDEILRIIKTVPKNESILIFIPSVDYFEDLIKKVPSASLVSSKTPKKERGGRIKCFLEEDLQIMCNSYLLGVGFDFPNLRVIIDALPTNSFRTHIQKVLRGVRICPEKGKTHCKVYDLAGNSDKFGKDLSEYTIEWLPKYGWGLFKGDRLMSDVAIQSQRVITKDDIIKNGGKVPTALDYKETQTAISVGKYKGNKLSQVMYKDVRYLRWMWENKVGGEELGKVLTKLFY